jgi:predicted anti-sigma-YlaC factor YlaD
MMGQPSDDIPVAPHRTQVTCQQVTALLLEYITEALDAVTHQIVEAHLQNCADCNAFLHTYQATIRVTKALHYEDIPMVMQERLLHALRNKIQTLPPHGS